jgi:hypothetical protein
MVEMYPPARGAGSSVGSVLPSHRAGGVSTLVDGLGSIGQRVPLLALISN